MNENFTASNGLSIDVEPDDDMFLRGVVGVAGHLSFRSEVTRALREFFRHERDEELGRWRLPRGQMGYAVYPKANGSVRVVEEITGQSEVVTRESVYDDLDAWWNEIGDAYFAAHPIQKPWHDAKPGEVWLITDDRQKVFEMTVVEGSSGLEFFTHHRLHATTYVGITAARRIWPEVSNG